MKKIITGMLVYCLMLVSPYVIAKDISASLSLLSMKAIKTSEKVGDELYFDISVFPSYKLPSHERIPQKPIHWPSRGIHHLNNLGLWKGVLKPQQVVTLIISLMEMDAPPWDTDDLIGSVRIRLKNNNGTLETSWSIPNRVDAPVAVLGQGGQKEKFNLLGENSNYELMLKLTHTILRQ